MLRLFLVLGFVLSAAPLEAATEYLRFEGIFSTGAGFYLTIDPYLEPLVPGQAVYFDLAVDTALDGGPYPDQSYTDYFSVSYLGGSIARSNSPYGVTHSYPEGTLTLLCVTHYSCVGDHSSGVTFGNKSISTWTVGRMLTLLFDGDSGHEIGFVQLTYRAAGAPPTIVPLPAAGPLLIAALAYLCGWRVTRVKPGLV